MAGRADSFPTVTVILRGYSYESCRCVAQGMVGSKLRSIEVAMNTPGAPEIIDKLSNEFGNEILVGAGTVTTPQRARSAIEAGSKVLLSPICFSDELFAIAKEAHVLSVPAAFSPSEICEMLEKGADIVKVFPASRLGAQYFSDIQAPLGPMPLMAVGGITTDNAQEYLSAGASFVGIGSGIFRRQDILDGNIAAIQAQIAQFEARIRW